MKHDDPRGVLSMYVIYDHPKDFPNNFVVRRTCVSAGKTWAGDECYVAVSLEAARAILHLEHPGLVNIGRYEDDDPVIAEVWI